MSPTLDDLLRGGEWNGAEFKAAPRALPKSVFETVSAFANTRGGWIVLGITQEGEHFEVSGVGEPDKVQNDFLSVLHASGKLLTLRTGEGVNPHQTPHVAPHVTAEVARLIGVMEGEMHRDELMTALGLNDRKHYQAHYQRPAIAQGLIEMTLPGKPRSRAQRYRLTALGHRMKQTSDTA